MLRDWVGGGSVHNKDDNDGSDNKQGKRQQRRCDNDDDVRVIQIDLAEKMRFFDV